MQKAQIPCHYINYNLRYRPANILWQQNENMPCNDAYNHKNHQIADFNSSTTEKYKKRHSKSPQGDKLHQLIQSIYKYNRRATNSRQRPNSLNLRRRGPFTWYTNQLKYFMLSDDITSPCPKNQTSPTKPAQQSQPDKYQNPAGFQHAIPASTHRCSSSVTRPVKSSRPSTLPILTNPPSSFFRPVQSKSSKHTISLILVKAIILKNKFWSSVHDRFR